MFQQLSIGHNVLPSIFAEVQKRLAKYTYRKLLLLALQVIHMQIAL